jgi:cytochrome P450
MPMELDFAFRPDQGLPASAFERVRAAGPVVWSDALQSWVVSSYAGVKRVLGETARFGSEGTPVQEAFGREAMLVTDTALHHTMRMVWAGQVSPKAMARRAEALEAIARRALEPVAARLRAGETADLVAAFQDYVTHVIAWMFEVPASCLPDLMRWNAMFSNAPAVGGAEGSRLHAQAKTEAYAFLHGVMADRRARLAAGERPQDLISLMVAAEGHDGITRDMAADNLLNFFLGALDTTAKWIGAMVVFLASRPDVRDLVRADREQLGPVMEEVMRLETVAQSLMRLTREDVELDGVRLEAGQAVIVMLGAANRDPAAFEDPASFRLDRGEAHVGFGFGFHHCLGAATARQETRSFLGVLLELLPEIEVARVDYGDSWAVWGPRALEVKLAPEGRAR